MPAIVPLPELKDLMRAAGRGDELTVDLDEQTIGAADDRLRFEMDPFVRHALLHGLDAIARTLQLDPDIAAFERRNPSLVSTTAL